MKKAISVILAAALVASVFTGCGKDAKSTATTNNKKNEQKAENKDKEEENKEEESKGPKVWRSAESKTQTLNPHTYTMASEGKVLALLSGSFVDMVYNEETEKPEFVPVFASELPSQGADKKVWTVKLRKDLRWEDGTPINAETFMYSLRMCLDPKLKNPNADSYISSLEILNASEYFQGNVDFEEVGLKATDEYTLEFTLASEVSKYDFYLNSSITPVHKELYEANMNEDKTETKYGTDIDKIMSCGPYKLTEWIRDQYKKFDKVDYETPAGKYYVADEIQFRVIEGYSTQFTAFEKGEIDQISVMGEQFDKYADDPRLVFDEVKYVWGFYVNTDNPVSPSLKNKDLRKALYHGMPRISISEGIFRTFEPVGTLVSSICMVDPDAGLKYKETEQYKAVEPKNAGTDETLAKEYFEKAYAANGNKQITFEVMYFEGQETMKQMAEVMEEAYETLFGRDKIDVQLKGTPASVAYEQYKQGKYDMGIGATGQNAFNPWDSLKVYRSDYPKRHVTFNSPRFDELQERCTIGDLVFKNEERIAALVEMEQIIIDEVAFIPVFQNNHAVMFQDRIALATDGKYYPIIGFARYQADILD